MFQFFKQRHNNFEQSVNPTLNELQELTSRFSYSATLYKTCYRTQLKQQKYSHVQCTSQELHHVNPSWSWMYNTLEYQLRDGLSEACQPQSDLTSLLIPIFTGMRRSNFKSHFWCYAMWSTVQICEDDYTRLRTKFIVAFEIILAIFIVSLIVLLKCDAEILILSVLRPIILYTYCDLQSRELRGGVEDLFRENWFLGDDTKCAELLDYFYIFTSCYIRLQVYWVLPNASGLCLFCFLRINNMFN